MTLGKAKGMNIMGLLASASDALLVQNRQLGGETEQGGAEPGLKAPECQAQGPGLKAGGHSGTTEELYADKRHGVTCE